jgi:amidase
LGRSAHDLEVSLVTTAGPDPIAARGYRLDLPTLENRKIADLRIAVWEDDELAPVSAEVRKRVNQVADALRAAGARVDHDARPTFGSAHSHETYQNLLQATMSARMPEADYQSLKSYVDALDPDDDSATARVFRAQVASFRMWKANDEQRAHLRWKWHEFFAPGGYDVLIAPIMPTSAFPHDHAAFGDRTIQVDNQDRPYFEQVFWAGLTGVSYLPSTVIPTGLDDAGLPIGVQIVGPEYGDLITIGVAKHLEAAGFRFTPPPSCVE